MKKNLLNRRSTEQISQRILYVLAGLCVLVFALFYLVGFDNFYIEDPNFIDPMFTDVLIGLMYFMLLAAISVGVWGVVVAYKMRAHEERVVNNVPKARISFLVFGGTAVLLFLSFLLGSSQPMRINGKMYTDVLWLKAADLFINSAFVLLIVVVAAVVYGSTKYYRKKMRP
ncbi:MAG TPA: beta-carotene 15,15'-monooxygenase [Prevotella sp.]